MISPSIEQLDVPGFGMGGFLGHYWSTAATIARWNKDLFVSQAATMTELTGVLMNADLEDIRPLVTEDSFLNRATSDIEDQLDAGENE